MATESPSLGLPPLHFSAPTPGTVTVHRASGIVSTSLFGTTSGEWTTARIEGLDFDTLLLSRGSNRACEGKLGGVPFAMEPHGMPLVTFIPQGVTGELSFFNDANTSSLLMFPPGRLAAMMPETSTAATSAFAMCDSEQLVGLFQLIEAEILAPEKEQAGQIETLTRMLAQALFDRPAQPGKRQRASLDISPYKLKRVLDYIDAHLGEPINLDAMAEVAELSRFYFSSIFKRATGRSPYRHLIYRRVARAQTQIAESKLSLAEIAAASGFSSPAHFSASFRRETGLSPSRYRALVRRGVAVPGAAIVQD